MSRYCIIHIKDGQVTNPGAVRKLFDELKDGRYRLELTKRNKRSLNQNDYYWLILTDYVQPALYQMGWREIKSKEDAHDFCREMFLKEWIINENTLERKQRIKSTTELSTVEFNTYLEEIWQWAAEYLQVTIPSPNQQLSIDV